MGRAILADEVLALSRDAGLGWEGNTPGVQHNLIPQDLLLAAALPKGSLAIQHLVQHHTSGPDVYLQMLTSTAGHLQCMPLSDHIHQPIPTERQREKPMPSGVGYGLP